MKQSDALKIQWMVKDGKSVDEIVAALKHIPEEEIRKFLPSEAPKKVTKKKVAKKAEKPSDDFLD